MTTYIQNIIEDNIDIIEQQDWKLFFTKWYYDYATFSGSTDVDHLREFFKICSDAEINAEEESYDIRKQIVFDGICDIIEEIFSDDPDVERVAMVRIVNELQSRLYLSLTELIPLYKEAVDTTGYKLAEDSLTIVRR